ncbi:hypothetical protein LEP1GSC191_1376 [Leptospira borgpetersenii serovar Mini str. 201000851]|uniref:Uncharacterized protein n=2 Tax=Leptospira borgpetersenii TaxID=174 RepID=M3FJT8_LEPBO|nr:hypothetical protein LEP1GSC128_1513 [Leptospira borgpetersenii str. 200801926]EMG02088.1 hypothetical protein LEP1GSC123_2703 [Leptospira borgpetersenii str. 200701203]ENO64009.1 hypothetical protein LEP1GSC191_1376 [Leptospira borgpetersenii serovar Mini str. 201000851]
MIHFSKNKLGSELCKSILTTWTHEKNTTHKSLFQKLEC